MIYFFIFFLGTLFGSFLNVVILRLPYANKSIIWPRSHCSGCKKNIAAYDLVPIV
ncbi:MAG: prepilin peptidase, partial [bacterium]|nr:prepilin peptidase [bacterium]